MDNSKLSLINESYKSAIRIAESKRSHTGRYKLVAKDKNGTDTCTCNVTVLDVPGPPEGPVEPKKVKKDSATIGWKIPQDDGGSEINLCKTKAQLVLCHRHKGLGPPGQLVVGEVVVQAWAERL